MYTQNIYSGMDKSAVLEKIRKKGFDPIIISNPSGYVYSKHKHDQTKLLAFLSGSMIVKVEEKPYKCTAGDELIIPGNTYHSAKVSEQGCTFYWAEEFI